MIREHVTHTFAPVYDKYSEILILGSFPSVKSREENFYYGHPKNRFWKVMAAVLACDVPNTIEEKKQMLLSHSVAVWDVIASCEIEGSSDSSIKNVIVNDFSKILETADIKCIFANGKTAGKLYQKYVREKTGREIVILPSTSPANAACSFEQLVQEYGKIRDWKSAGNKV